MADLPFDPTALPDEIHQLADPERTVELERALEELAAAPDVEPDVVIAHAWAFDRNTEKLLYFQEANFKQRLEPILERMDWHCDRNEQTRALFRRLVYAYKQ